MFVAVVEKGMMNVFIMSYFCMEWKWKLELTWRTVQCCRL